MSFKHIALAVLCILLLSACSSESSKQTESSSSVMKDTQTNQTETVTVQTNEEQTEVTQQQSSNEEEKAETTSTQQTAVEENVTANQEVSNQNEELQTIEKEQQDSKEESTQQEKQDVEKVGYSVVEGDVDEVEDIPQEDEMNILATFNEYIDAFNDQDLNRYKSILARNPEGFNLQEDLLNTKNIFENFDMKRTASNITITDYTGSRANVYADILVEVTQNNSEVRDEGKQLTQLVKESSGWKITSLQAIGSAANRGQ